MVTFCAPAKINLYLHVTGKREDGYHLLDSLVAFTGSIGDKITIAPAGNFSLRLTGPMAAGLAATPADDNLVVRAARALAAATGRSLNCTLTLEKNLPLASGIGGGSSDAAATLLALAAFWRLDKTALPLEAIARRLGQDIVACLHRRPCYFRGIGDHVDFAPALPPVAILLANPGLHIPTPAIFRQRTGPFTPAAPLALPADLPAFIAQLKTRRNDLYPPAIGLAPAIAGCRNALAATPGCLFAAMSGSGATCFALYEKPEQAAAAQQSLAAAHAGWWTAAGALPFTDREYHGQ